MFAVQISRFIYHFIARLLFNCFAGNFEEHHTATEDSYSASVGPLHLELNECFVLDHADAGIGLRLPLRQGSATLGLRVCVGNEQIREPGLYFHHAPV